MHPHSIVGSKLNHCLLIDAKQGDLKIWKAVQMPRSIIWVLSWLKTRVLFLAPFSAVWTEFQEATDCQFTISFDWAPREINNQWVSWWIALWDRSDIAGFVAIYLGQTLCNFSSYGIANVCGKKSRLHDSRMKFSLFSFICYSATRSHLHMEERKHLAARILHSTPHTIGDYRSWISRSALCLNHCSQHHLIH